MTDKVKYLDHPVSPQDKQKWCGQGFKIVDARFAPDQQSVAPVKKSKVDKAAKPSYQ